MSWKNSHLPGAVDGAAIDELSAEPRRAQALGNAFEVRLVFRHQVTRRDESGWRQAFLEPEDAVRVGEIVQALLGRNAGEVADGEWIARRKLRRARVS